MTIRLHKLEFLDKIFCTSVPILVIFGRVQYSYIYRDIIKVNKMIHIFKTDKNENGEQD